MSFFDENAPALDAFARMSARAGARADYVQGGGGNTSVKLGDAMAIKASGLRLSQVSARSGYSVLALAPLRAFFGADPPQGRDVEAEGTAAIRAAALDIAGLNALRPSVESGFHSLMGRYVLHTHCVWANIALCAQDGAREAAQALDGSGLDLCFTPYTNPGAALTFAVREALRGFERAHGRRPGLVLMQGHGLIASADDAELAFSLHERASALMARRYGWDMADYPARPLRELGQGEYASDCAFLRARLASGDYGARELIGEALYPDQLVFLKGNIALCQRGDAPDAACNIYPDGRVIYRCARPTAEAIEQTLTAVVFIREAQRAHGLRALPMAQAAQNFISTWEAEAARRQLMSGQAAPAR